MRADIYFSLIVGTFDRLPQMELLFNSLSKIEKKNFEVIIVDQNEDDKMTTLISNYLPEFIIKHIKIKERNISKVRNIGARHAAGIWLGFPDDDCVYSSDTLLETEKIINTVKADLISGLVLDFEGKPLYFRKDPPKSGLVSVNNLIGKHSEPTLFIKKAVFSEINGFNEYFGPGSVNYAAEGMELCLLALNRKKRMYFSNSIQVYHPRKFPPYNKHANQIAYQYSYGNSKVLATYNQPRVLRSLTRAVILMPVKLIFFKKERVLISLNVIKGTIDGLRNKTNATRY